MALSSIAADPSASAVAGIGFLSLAVLSSVAVALILRVGEARGVSRLAVIASNYVTAAALNACLWWRSGFASLDGLALPLGITTGVLFVVGFLLLSASIGAVGVAAPVSLGRLAVVAPVAVAVVFYGEKPTAAQAVGLALVPIAFLLFGRATGNDANHAARSRRTWLLLGGMFCCFGASGISMKVFEEHCAAEQLGGFLTLLFGTALVLSWFCVVLRRQSVSRQEALLGLLLGVPNALSSVFFLMALRHLKAVVAFPINDMAVVVGATLAAWLIWREKPSPTGWLALTVALAAIICMNVR